MKLYELEQLTRDHGSRRVLDIEALTIETGHIYSLIGPNGAGKTSLLKILSFLDRPTGGMLRFMGEVAIGTEQQLLSLRRRVVLLDQTPIMFTGTVASNVGYGLKVRGVGGDEIRSKVEAALQLVGMEGFASYPAQGLSGGETKRVALARALVLKPDVLLCDEPTANVDQENQEIILSILERANREQGTSIIFSTHHLSQGQRLAEKTLLLQNGRLSDLAGENIFRVNFQHHEDGLICSLGGGLRVLVDPDVAAGTLGMQGAEAGKLHLEPRNLRLHLNPSHKEYAKPGSSQPELPSGPAADRSVSSPELWNGHIISLAQESGLVRICVDVGVRLFVVQSMADYRKSGAGLGDRVSVEILPTAVSLTPLRRF